MKHRLARLVLVSFVAGFAAAAGLAPGSASASYQSTDGGLGAVDPARSFPQTPVGAMSATGVRGFHSEIPVLSGSDLKGEPSFMTEDWVTGSAHDAAKTHYVLHSSDPAAAPEAIQGDSSGWIAAAVAFVAFQLLYASIKLVNWIAFSERDRPLGTPRRAQIARALRQRHRRMRLLRASMLLAQHGRSLAWGIRRRA